MRRREFIALLAGSAVWPLQVRAQQALKKIGFVSWRSPTLAIHAEEFRKGLSKLGYVEGKDVQVEVHFTDGNRERTKEVLGRLLQNGVDVLVVSTSPAIQIANETTRTIPIVMAPVSDAIAAGFAQSLARPGGNLTGVSTFGPTLASKRIELLKEIRPGLRIVAFLGLSRGGSTGHVVRSNQAEANRNGLKFNAHLVDGPEKIHEGVFDAIRRDGAEAVIVHSIFTGHQNRIVGLARKAQLPVISDYSVFAEAGAVFAYGIDDLAQMRRVAYFVDRILKGESPSELPIEQPTEFRLVVNAEAIRQFGWTVPASVLARADEVIE